MHKSVTKWTNSYKRLTKDENLNMIKEFKCKDSKSNKEDNEKCAAEAICKPQKHQ